MKRLIATALLLAGAATAEAGWSFGVAGMNAGRAFTPLATQFTFADRELCERTLLGLREHGFVVFGTHPPTPTSEEPVERCWPSDRAPVPTPPPAP